MPAPPLLALRGVHLQDGPRPLFAGVDLALEPRVRACLVGRNGAGKSTLLRMLAGQIVPDSGDRTVTPATRIAYVPQEPPISAATVLDHAISGGAEPWMAEAWLTTFGLDPAKSATNLSGGEARRAALAKAFAEQPDVLLLDEPTNHLDIAAIQTLEAELVALTAALLVVSHDRAFLARVTRRTFWLEHRLVRRLDKGFAAFDAWSAEVAATEAEDTRRLQKALAQDEHWLQRGVTARRARNEGRRRRLMSLRAEVAARRRDTPRELTLTADAGAASGKLVIEAKGISKNFAPRSLIPVFSTRILRGDRVALVGPNGAGKTTLVRLLLGELAPDAGSIRHGANLTVAYLDQSRAPLDEEQTLWQVLAPHGDQLLVGGQPRHVAAYAQDFLFTPAQLRQPVRTLSGGERNRLLLARALAQPANLLVLDEPTNDLDMETLDLLEEVLADYEGTLLLVSHDRDFIDRLATSTIALDGRGRIVETPGGWTDFLHQNPGFLHPESNPSRSGEGGSAKRSGVGKDRSNTGLTDKPGFPHPSSAAPEPPSPKGERSRKLSFRDTHRLTTLETRLAALPTEIAAAESALADPALYARSPAAFTQATARLDALRVELAAAEDEWLTLEAKREASVG